MSAAGSSTEGIHLQGVTGTFTAATGIIQTSTGTAVLIGAAGGGTASSGGAGPVVAVTTGPTGITVTSIQNIGRSVTANIEALCDAALGPNTVVFTVNDANGGSASSNFTVNVTANTPPALSYNTDYTVASTAGRTITPISLGDNGSIASVVLVSKGAYAGGISVDPATGVVTLTGAAPIGTHTITVRATDNCGAQTNASFTLNVTNNAPTITLAAAVTRQQRSTGTVSTVATVSDLDQTAGTLTAAATTVPAGLTVTNITNTNGTIAATVAALCGAVVGPNTIVFTVTDSNGGSATASFTVNVTANSVPTLTYSNASVPVGGSATLNPATGPSDNGTISSIALRSQGTYRGGIAVDNTTGAISITGAARARRTRAGTTPSPCSRTRRT
jgi:hypothetical protein